MTSPALNCKLVVLGDSGVGKTSLIHRYVQNQFRADFKATIGADFNSKTINVANQEVDLQIWDTAGDERFHSVGAAFYRGTDACILVYDVTQRESFNRLKAWEQDLFTKSGIDQQDFPIVVFGNKADLEAQRQVSAEEGQQFGRQNDVPVFEVSAMSGQNLGVGFEKIVEVFLARAERVKKDTEPVTIKLKLDANNERKKDCSC